MASVDWETDKYESGRNFDAIPKGRYLTRIDKIEKKDTKNKDGYFFEIEVSVEKGDCKGRKLWARLNVSNPSEIAQRIGREQFNALTVAVGLKIGEVRDTKILVAKKAVCIVDIEKDQQGNPRNVITGFLAMTAADAAQRDAPKTERGSTPAGAAALDDDDIPF